MKGQRLHRQSLASSFVIRWALSNELLPRVRHVNIVTSMNQTDLPPAASVAAIRRHFPALRRLHGQEPVAYFDGPGGTQVPEAVVEAMRRLSAASQRQHALALSRPAKRPTRRSRRRGRRVADLLHCGADEVVVRRQHVDDHLPSRTGAGAPVGPRRRDRHHRARSPRQPGHLARRCRGSRADGARGRSSIRRGSSSTGTTSRGRSRRRRSWSRSARRRTPSARSTTSRARWRWPRRWAR